MLSTVLCLSGKSKDAIEFYQNTLNAKIEAVIPNKDNIKLIDHAEILIHNCLLMINDFGGSDGEKESNGYLLSLRFETEEELKNAYHMMEKESKIISPMSVEDYTVCQVVFIDKFGVRWGFWVKKLVDEIV